MKSDFFTGMDDADEMIRANGEAEAREADRLREENGTYEERIDELTQLYLKNSRLIEEMKEICDQNTEDIRSLASMQDSTEASTHKDCVRVYRNVQAALISELDRQTKDLETSFDELRQNLTNIDAEVRGLTEERMNRPKAKSSASPFTILTFVIVLVMLLIEVSDRAGIVAQLVTILGI